MSAATGHRLAAPSVPDIAPDTDVLSAALAYAACGLYVGPVRAGTKHPGSVLGAGWQRLTSRDPDVIAAWFAGADHGVFIHAGRSGLLVFDVDRPELVPDDLRQALAETQPPYQTTRHGDSRRGHYLFRQPPGRDLGNSVGALGGAWGEVRGRNGVIVVAPSTHAEAHTGGEYAWQRTGPVPALPSYLADAMPDAMDAADAATDQQVTSFLAEHAPTSPPRPELVGVHVTAFERKIDAGASRHDSMTGHLAGAMKEARAGLVDAATAADTLQSAFLAAVARPPTGQGQGQSRTGATARSEWAGLLAWAVAQARATDPAEVRARVEAKVPDAAAHLSTPGVTPLDEDEAAPVGEDPADMVRRCFPRLDLAKLLAADRPEREWVIAGLLPAGVSASLIAPAGTGKSLLMLAGTIAVARGDRTFAGLPVTPRRVLLVDMENSEDDLAGRLRALGITPTDVASLDNLIIVHLPPMAPLDTAAGGLQLAAILDTYNIEPGDVVVLDSLQRVINGAENDSDTIRAYYRHTGMMLKRRGVTVVRTDNTGKDAERGARGSSGKRDDVDVELILTRDAEQPNRLRIKPGKVRLPGVEPLVLTATVDDDGQLIYSSAGDPFRLAIADAHRVLDDLDVPIEAGERKVAEAVRAAGHKVPRSVLRVAIRERRDTPDVRGLSAPSPYGAPNNAPGRVEVRRDQTAHLGAPNGESANTQVSTGKDCAEGKRRTPAQPDSGAPEGGAPGAVRSIERRTPRALPVSGHPEPDRIAADLGTCGNCQQPGIRLVGTDRRGRPACGDCCTNPPVTTTEGNAS